MRKSDWMALYSSFVERLDYEARARGLYGILPPEEVPVGTRMAYFEHGIIARDRLPVSADFDPLADLEDAPEIPSHLSGYTREEPEMDEATAEMLIADLKLSDPWKVMPRGYARRTD